MKTFLVCLILCAGIPCIFSEMGEYKRLLEAVRNELRAVEWHQLMSLWFDNPDGPDKYEVFSFDGKTYAAVSEVMKSVDDTHQYHLSEDEMAVVHSFLGMGELKAGTVFNLNGEPTFFHEVDEDLGFTGLGHVGVIFVRFLDPMADNVLVARCPYNIVADCKNLVDDVSENVYSSSSD